MSDQRVWNGPFKSDIAVRGSASTGYTLSFGLHRADWDCPAPASADFVAEEQWMTSLQVSCVYPLAGERNVRVATPADLLVLMRDLAARGYRVQPGAFAVIQQDMQKDTA